MSWNYQVQIQMLRDIAESIRTFSVRVEDAGKVGEMMERIYWKEVDWVQWKCFLMGDVFDRLTSWWASLEQAVKEFDSQRADNWYDRDADKFQKALWEAADSMVQIADAIERAQAGDAPKPLAAPTAMAKSGRRVKISDEKNLMAREFLSANPRATVRELANGIGCSKGLAGRLPAWKAVAAMKKAKGVKTPKVISFTPTIESQVGDRDAELAQLMGEQAEDKNRGHRLRRRV